MKKQSPISTNALAAVTNPVSGFELPVTNTPITNNMITEKELTSTGFKLDNVIEDKDSPFDEENNLQVRTWAKQKNELKIEVAFGARRGGLEEPFWVDFEQSIDLYINNEYHTLKHITKIHEVRLLLFSLKM